ncbi:MAG: glutamate synthase subunit alpha, partial [Propionibacterium sp.]|nr:glutamate synthase subunit alpha [Propionibacterium sp.]
MTAFTARGHAPTAQGLYDPLHEHDACGVAFVATLSGEPSHAIVQQGLEALRNLDHRGATGADTAAGDGAGILIQVPDAFLRGVVDFELPAAGAYAMGMVFMPTDPTGASTARDAVARIAEEEGLRVLGWRAVPHDASTLSPVSTASMPDFQQLFVTATDAEGRALTGLDLDRAAFVLRVRATLELDLYFASLSARTTVYKGMLTTDQLGELYPDLHDERMASALALVHSRFSTNTFPSWRLAHPFRMIAHNGEINTVRGNRNWMRAREALLDTDLIPGDLQRLFPIAEPGSSDSGIFDQVLELLHLGGRSLPHAVLMMIPEAWENNSDLTQQMRDFYEFHSCLMEPWDGPACMTFTDGTLIGAVLDRNGLRPGRYWVTHDGLVVLASEAGVLDIPADRIATKGRLQPGRMFLADLAEHRIVPDEEIKRSLSEAEPYGEWLAETRVNLNELPQREHVVHTHSSVVRRQQVFGYTEEELRLVVAPMANTGAEPIGSMGSDTPPAVLSGRPRLLFDYFIQHFAQVTNPPLDAIREELVTSLRNTIGPEENLLDPGPRSMRQIVLPYPILNNDELKQIVQINRDGDLPDLASHVLRCRYRVAEGADGLRDALDALCAEASEAIESGAKVLVISDRHSTADLAPIPSLLATAAVHHHLVRQKSRTRVGLVVEAGDVREVHHAALLIGYGAAAINPYLLFESAEDLSRQGSYVTVEPDTAVTNIIKALGKGVVKVMSKMGVSTVASYTGAQIFEALGLSEDVIERYFTGTVSKLGGIGLTELAAEVESRHRMAHPSDGVPPAHRNLWVGGDYQWRREGEEHLFDPETVFRLQHSTRNRRFDVFRQYTARVNERAERLMTLRGLLEFRADRTPVPLDEVEPASEIVKRFSTGAMSYGSISREAHETLAIAMNRLGGKSNTGEG